MSYAIVPSSDGTYRIADHDGSTVVTCVSDALAKRIVDALKNSPATDLQILAEHRLETIHELVRALEAIHKLADSSSIPPEALRSVVRTKAREALQMAKG